MLNRSPWIADLAVRPQSIGYADALDAAESRRAILQIFTRMIESMPAQRWANSVTTAETLGPTELVEPA
jgi:hypothetical protein